MIDPAKLKPEQIKHIQREIRRILIGMVLKIAPVLSLLLAGLILGLLPAIPVYLVIRLACRWGQLKREAASMSRVRLVAELFAYLLGGISLATRDPIWFKLEITLIAILALAALIVSGRSFLADIEPFPPANLIGAAPASMMRYIFISGLVVAPIVNLWLALQLSDTAWLLFRTLVFFLWIAAFAALGMWFITRKTEDAGI